jgi:hypothetical protein
MSETNPVVEGHDGTISQLPTLRLHSALSRLAPLWVTYYLYALNKWGLSVVLSPSTEFT